MVYTRDQLTFSVKGPVVNILGFEGHTVSRAAAQGCGCVTKAVTDDSK